MPDQRLPKVVGSIALLVGLVPLVLAVWPIEGSRFFVLAGVMCLAAPLAGLWWGDRRGQTDATRAALGCVGTLVVFGVYALWSFVIARWIFDRYH